MFQNITVCGKVFETKITKLTQNYLFEGKIKTQNEVIPYKFITPYYQSLYDGEHLELIGEIDKDTYSDTIIIRVFEINYKKSAII